jgi:hypothetical protein
LGNPLSFVSSLGTGVIDFFYEPAQGLIKSPKAFMRGVVKGTSSLVSNTTSGFLGIAGRISSSVGQGVLFTLSKDNRFMQSRERLAKERGDIYTRPVRDFFHGIFHGVTGIIVDPYYGARRGGCRGCVLGLGQGVIGVVAKPVVGVLDAVAHTSEGFRDLALVISLDKRLRPLNRRRYPHTFAVDGRIAPYDTRLSQGVMILQHIRKGRATVALEAVQMKSEGGGAMAKVEAAGRTVITSTKQVVSAVAGTLNIVEAREESLDGFGSEFQDVPILVEVIRKGPVDEIVLIVTTARIVCVESRSQGPGDTPAIELKWQVPLRAVAGVDLKNMPLVLTLDVDLHLSSKLSGGSSFSEEKEKELLRRDGSVIGRVQRGHQGHDDRVIQKRVFGDWQKDNMAFTRVYNLLQCLRGSFEE